MSLISTGDIRTWLGIPAADTQPNAKFDQMALAVDDFADAFTNRQLEAADYETDPRFSFYDGNGASWIYTAQFPLSSVADVWVDADRAFGDGTKIASADRFFYPDGKIESIAGRFMKGRRNVKIHYKAGYAPVVGGTHDQAVSTYPVPYDLKQVMIELAVQGIKEGVTAMRTVENDATLRFQNMLSKNSFWRMTLEKYKKFDSGLGGFPI